MFGGDSCACACVLVVARRAMKRQEEQPEDVERRQPGGQHSERSRATRFAYGPQRAASRISSLLKNPEKPGVPAIASVAASIVAVGPRDGLAKAAHAAHVLLAAQRVHHAAGAEKEQALEEGMRHQVEDARAKRADAAAQEHVAQLADGRVGQHLLDVGLHQGDGRGKKSG